MEFLKSNIWEINKSSALQFFGGLIGIVHLLAYLSWQMQGANAPLPLMYHADPMPMCWSLFETCQWVKIIPPNIMVMLFYAFGAFAALSAALFFFTRLFGLAWFSLLVCFTLKLILVLQDARLGDNLDYLVGLQTFAFLFVPSKLLLVRFLFISFFVTSAFLKLSPNWLTGHWYIENLKVPVKLGEWLAGISVLAEFLAPVALLFRDIRNFLLGYAALIIYFALIWYTGGYEKPLVLLLLLQLFPLVFYEERKIEREYLYQSFIRPEPSKVWAAILIVLFFAVQALPFATYRPLRQASLMAKNVALSPVPASEECETVSFLIFEDRMQAVTIAPSTPRVGEFKCSPYLAYLDIKNLCSRMRAEPGFKTVMSFMTVRGLKDASFRTAFEESDFCRDGATYSQIVGAHHGI